MPLKRDASEESMNSNIEQLIKDGYKPKQAVAIAYSIQRKSNKKMSRHKKG